MAVTLDEYPWQINHGSKYYSAVGYLCHQWNILERLYTHRASDIMGLRRTKHDLIFRHLGTVSIGTFMNEYAEAYIKSAEVREQLVYVIKFVDACRINRNAIIHGWAAIDEDQTLKNIRVRSRADQRRSKESEFVIGLADVRRVCEEIEMGARLIVAVSFLFGRNGIKNATRLLGENWRSRLLVKPPLPRLIVANQKIVQRPKRLRRPARS